jgi:hypothetical protein
MAASVTAANIVERAVARCAKHLGTIGFCHFCTDEGCYRTPLTGTPGVESLLSFLGSDSWHTVRNAEPGDLGAAHEH